MKIEQLLLEAHKECADGSGNLTSELLIDWIIKNNRFEDVLSAIKEDGTREIELRKKYREKKITRRLQNSDTFVSIASLLVQKGHKKEADIIFTTILDLTPDDTSALNDYGFSILFELFGMYKENKKFDREKIESALKPISKAAAIDKCLFDEPHVFPAYKNLCLLRAVEAAYYLEEKHVETAFIMAWISIEMTIYRLWHILMIDNSCNEDLSRWNVDTVMEVLFLSKFDETFQKLKPELDSLKGLRNDLIHGEVVEITNGQAERCIDIAWEMMQIKKDYVLRKPS